MIKYSVYFTTVYGETLVAGTLLLKDNLASFKYDPLFLKKGIPLDPAELPLIDGAFHSKKGLFSVFEDALPDGWGQALIVRRYGNAYSHPNAMLSKLNLGKSVGALSFSLANEPLSVSTKSPSVDRLSDFIAQIENNPNQSTLDAASSAGGAQPKFVLDDNGTGVIVKFPHKNELNDLAGLEAASMSVAKDIGLNVPYFYVGTAGGRRYFKIQRFDLRPDGGRNHCISMKTLLSADGYYRKGYIDVATALKAHSYDPKNDCRLLFKQCTLNALLGNTDDHLKNFMMMHDGKGYRLSPCYDILPNVKGSMDHVLSFDTDTLSPRLSELISLGNRMGVDNPASIVHDVAQALDLTWAVKARYYDVNEDQIEKYTKDIQRRLAKVEPEDEEPSDLDSGSLTI